MQYRASLQFRTTLDQAGRIAGLSGELDVSEAEILRDLVDEMLARPKLLEELRGRVKERAAHRERLSELAAEGDVEGLVAAGVSRSEAEKTAVRR
jgi:hypothetical protein